MTTQASHQYLDYLRSRHISYICCGVHLVDLVKACDILAGEFHVERLGIVGGPTINTAFLDTGLLDEIDVLVAPGIDGRPAFPPLFNGRNGDAPVALVLKDVRTFDNGDVLLSYRF